MIQQSEKQKFKAKEKKQQQKKTQTKQKKKHCLDCKYKENIDLIVGRKYIPRYGVNTICYKKNKKIWTMNKICKDFQQKDNI